MEKLSAKELFESVTSAVNAYQKDKCEVDGCDRRREVRNICWMHYARLKKVGKHPKTEPRVKIVDSHIWFVNELVSDGNNCLEWPFSTGRDGYGIITFKHTRYRVSAIACELANGPRGKDMVAAHECGNKICVRPSHLSWKTQKENIADKERHGTKIFGERHPMSILTAEDVLEIRKNSEFLTRKELAAKYGVKVPTVSDVINRATWKELA